ncbi:MAG: FkbM family methyltransferase [Vicinamibacterales bacterium]
MRFLFIAKQKKNIDTFQGAVARLLADGHEVVLVVQDRTPAIDARIVQELGAPGLSLATAPAARGDAWRTEAPLVRSLRDWLQYSRAPYAGAGKLRQRALEKLEKELVLSGTASGLDLAAADPARAARLRRLLALVEASIPADALHREFIARHAPDVVLVTPGVHFGSAQADFVKAARALGIPAWMLLFSWDNLSTKGALHVMPDLLFVWNEHQRTEAGALHDVPADRVVVVGAPRFDEFFTLRPAVSRPEFFRPLGLDPARPTLLYVCSSRFVAGSEVPFIRTWLAALRRSPRDVLRTCNVIIRPHPDVDIMDGGEVETVGWRDMPQASGWVQRPFEDPGAIVLRTTYRTQQAFFECLHHAAAVVGLNTSAELEAGIAGRPVFTARVSDGQSDTLHFNYLLHEHGGFVHCAPDLDAHAAQLADALEAPPDGGAIARFIRAFLRPRGDQPVSALLADELAARCVAVAAARVQPGAGDVSAGAQGPETVASDLLPGEAHDGGALASLGTASPDALPIAYAGARVLVRATPETRKHVRHGRVKLDPHVHRWLDTDVQPGDVVYDIGAGVGTCALVAAVARGALSVAFEPGFAAFAHLCDNVLLNGCGRAVIPLPVALGAHTGLLELQYPHAAGDDHHSLRADRWRPRADPAGASYVQPVCAERLDDVVARHGLPPANALRIGSARQAASVLAGAATVLGDERLRSVLVAVRGDDGADALTRTLLSQGFALSPPDDGEPGGRMLHFHRAAGAGRDAGTWRRLAFWT